MPHIIYGLIDPITSELRYIGYTSNPCRRLQQHHSKAELKRKTYKNNWIRSLLKRGLTAGMIVLEECQNREQLAQAEIMQIAHHHSMSARLTNGTRGGDSGPLKHSAGTKRKISNSLKGHAVSIQTRTKISETKKNPTPEARRNISASQRRRCSFNKSTIAKVRSLSSRGIGTIKISKIIGCCRGSVKRILQKYPITNKKRLAWKTWKVIGGKRVWIKKT